MQFGDIATDPKKESEGVWIRYSEDLCIRVARMWSTRYHERLTELVEAEKQRAGPVPPEAAERCAKIAFAETCLVDWVCADGDLDETLTPVRVADALYDESDVRPVESRVVHVELARGETMDVEELRLDADGPWFRVLSRNGAGVTLRQIIRLTPDLVRRLVVDDRYRDLYISTHAIAHQQHRYRLMSLEESAGN